MSNKFVSFTDCSQAVLPGFNSYTKIAIVLQTDDHESYRKLETSVTIRTGWVQKTKPFAQECFDVEYFQNKIRPFVNKKELVPSEYLHTATGGALFDIFHYAFHANPLFGFQISFKIFKLTDMCLHEQESSDPELSFGTEYLTVNNSQKNETFYYCLKRPQWTLFTTSYINILYHICKLCQNINSQIVFNYQIINGQTIVTERDSFTTFQLKSEKYKSTMKPYLFGIVCYHKIWTCSGLILKYIIMGEKYQTISVWKQKIDIIRIIIISFSTHGDYFTEFTLWASPYYCMLQAVVDNYKRNSNGQLFKNVLQYKFKYAMRQEILIHNKLSINLTYKALSCKSQNICHTVFRITTLGLSYIQLTVNGIVFTGWKTPKCFYGGISIHEMTNNRNSLKEIVRLCGNFTVSKTEQTLDHDFLSYTSASNEVWVVVFHHPADVLNIFLHISTSSCKGVFVNPCLDSTFPIRYKYKVLHYPSTEYPDDCIVYHFSFMYLASDEIHGNDIAKSGCMRNFYMTRNTTYCSATLKYFQYYFQPNYRSTIFNTSDSGDTLYFSSNLNNGRNEFLQTEVPDCAETFEYTTNYIRYRKRIVSNSEWYRGLSVYRIKEKNLINISYKLVFQANIVLLAADQQQIDDVFWSNTLPFSETQSILILQYLKCKGYSQSQLPTETANLVEGMKTCLTKAMKGIIPENTRLEISIHGNFSCNSCQFAYLQFYSVLCLSVHATILEYFKFASEPEFWWCDKSVTNYGEDRLIWEATLDYLMVSISNVILVDLPGKIFDARFITSHNMCVKNRTCWVNYRWAIKDDLPHVKLASVNETSFIPPEVSYTKYSINVSRDYMSPYEQTWYEAQELCTTKGKHLPSISSSRDIDDIMYFLRKVSHMTLLKYIFIGMRKKVSILNKKRNLVLLVRYYFSRSDQNTQR